MPGVPVDRLRSAQRLAPSARLYLSLRAIIDGSLVFALVLAGILLLPVPMSRPALIGALVLLALGGAVIDLALMVPLRIRWTEFSVDATAIRILRGRVFRSAVHVPVSQVLNVQIRQGPLLRRLGLAALRFTAITDVQAIVPVELAEAERLRDVVLDAGAGRR